MLNVSVIIPNFNRASLIGETIENMLSQTLKPKEIIVVDDGSTDNSVEVIKSFGSRVNLICQQNQGPGAARNAGLKIASGEYIQFFDSDDLCTLNKLESQAKALETSGADIAYSPWAKLYMDSDSQKIRFQNEVIQQKELPSTASPLNWLLRGWTIVFQSCMFRHSFIKKVGNYRTDFMTCEDSEFLFRMLTNQPRLDFVPECLVLYRLHLGQITNNGTSQAHRIADWFNYCRIMESHLKEKDIKTDLITILRFRSRIWQAQKNYENITKNITNISKASMHPLNYQTSDLKDFLWKIMTILLLIERSLRRRLQLPGYAYPYAYQSSPITEYQYQIIQNMGYTIEI